jgi:DNA polymerase III alpha subunit
MAAFTLEDQTGGVRSVAFPDAFAKLERLLADGAAVLATATLRSSDAEHVELSVEEALSLEGIEAKKASALRVLVDLARHADEGTLERLHALCLSNEGRLPVRLRLLGDGWQAELTPTRVLGVDAKALAPAVSALLGPGHVEFIFNGS